MYYLPMLSVSKSSTSIDHPAVRRDGLNRRVARLWLAQRVLLRKPAVGGIRETRRDENKQSSMFKEEPYIL